MSKKVLPTKVVVGDIVKLAHQFGLPEIMDMVVPEFALAATLPLTKKGAAEFLTGAVKELVGEETFAEHTKEMESPEAASLRAQIALANQVLNGILAKHTGDKFDYKAFLAESGPVSQQIVKMEEELAKLGSIESVVLAKAVEVFGDVVFDYKEDTLVWRQQVNATEAKFGVSYLVLAPIGEDAPDELQQDKGKIAVCKEIVDPLNQGQWMWEVVAILPPNGENSTFFKDVAALVGKPATTDGVNAVEFHGAGNSWYPVMLADDVVVK